MNPAGADNRLPTGTDFECTEPSFRQIQRILKERKRFNLESYKDKCMKRRIAIRVRATRSGTCEEYAALIERDDHELDRLVKVLTIHVSQFFRNPPTFEKLRDDVIPHLFQRSRAAGTGLTVWSVGCAAGEEPYSLAIMLHAHFAAEMAAVPVSIVATDVDAEVLERARDGEYGEDRVAGVDPALRARYFHERDGRFLLHDEIRRMVTFCRGDLFHVEEYPPCDLILCRNVLIYFERTQQERIIKGFARALPVDGVLVLGKSETLVGESRRLFRTICPVERIYGRMP